MSKKGNSLKSKQQEAFDRINALFKLWHKLHDKICVTSIDTKEQYYELANEGRHLVVAYDAEVEAYSELSKIEAQYLPTLEMIHELQHFIMHVGHHLLVAQERLDDIARGKVAFLDMAGQKPKKPQLLN